MSRQTSRFCARCGASLKASDGTDHPWPDLSRSLIAKGGERKHVTILFADISNSTSLIDSLGDAELGMRRLQPALEIMHEAVKLYDGVVNKSQGDGVMALFGAPQPREDHAVRGCIAALRMLEAFRRFPDKELKIRVGIHTGEVVVQAIEHGIYQTYDAAGSNVHLASRIEQLASPGSVVISKETYLAAKQFVEVKPLGLREIRGISAPAELYLLTGIRHAPSSNIFRSRGNLSSLAGRSEQMAALMNELEKARAGDGRVVGVVGEAGIGKSRLCFEFTENCRAKGTRVFEAHVLSHGRAIPFQPILELLRSYFGIRDEESTDASRRRVLDRLQAFPISEQASLVLLDFLALSDPQKPSAKVDPKVRKAQLLELVRILVQGEPRDVPAVVLIEDLHWIDAASEEFVETLADAVVGTTTLLVTNFRPEFRAPMMQRLHYRQINMPPLETGHAQSIVREHFGSDSSIALLSRNLIHRAQGNPFFLEELVNALIDRGDLEGTKGSYRLRGGLESVPLPTNVQAVISARIDRLDEAPKKLLEVASVVGREISEVVLKSITGLPDHEISEGLRNLRYAELLYHLPPFEQRIFSFRHPLIQDVVYQSLLQDRRRELHLSVARAIETVHTARLEERASLLAYHFEQAGDNVNAAQQNMRAAVWVGANDPSQALRSWKKVRELLTKATSSTDINYLQMTAAGQIVNFGWREGMSSDDARVYFEEANELALALNDTRANALIHAAYGRILANGGSADEYVRKILEATEIADRGKDISVQITLKAVLCHAYRLAGRMSDALAMNIEAADRAHEIVKFDRQTLGFDVEIWLSAMRGHTLVTLDRGDEARPFLDRILQLKDDQVDAIHYVIPSLAYVDFAWRKNDPNLAQEHADRAHSLAQKSTNPYLRVYAQAARGLSHIVGRRFSSAIEDLSDALNFARTRKAGLENEPHILAILAYAHSCKGDTSLAAPIAKEAIEIATKRNSRVAECLARIVHGGLLVSSDQIEQGKSDLIRARELIEETGAVIFEPLLDSANAVVDANRTSRMVGY